MRFDWRAWRELDTDLLYDLLAIRQRVFVVEQACAYLDADGEDRGAHHLFGWHDGGLAAYLRLLPPDEQGAPRIGRVLTVPPCRGAGFGRPLMREGLDGAFRQYPGAREVRIGAQAHLAGFYGSLGFVAAGDVYDEDGIPHLPMVYARPG